MLAHTDMTHSAVLEAYAKARTLQGYTLERLTILLQYELGKLDTPLSNEEVLNISLSGSQHTQLNDKLTKRKQSYDPLHFKKFILTGNEEHALNCICRSPIIQGLLCEAALNQELTELERCMCKNLLAKFENLTTHEITTRAMAALSEYLLHKTQSHHNKLYRKLKRQNKNLHNQVANLQTEIKDLKQQIEHLVGTLEKSNTSSSPNTVKVKLF